MARIIRTAEGWGVVDGDGDGTAQRLRHSLAELLAGAALETAGALDPDAALLAPVDEQEVWAAGVTYERSLHAREEESQEPDVYERVYSAARPELFFKAPAWRVLGPGAEAGVRADSTWDVPEPEVVLVLDTAGRIFGYTVGDDVSSRSIEGENPLYLPQAKVYEGSCVIGPWITMADNVQPPFDVSLTVRRAGAVTFEGTTSTAKMHRSFEELASWLARGMSFPAGALLMTGTGIVPDDSFTLTAGDEVEITADQLGTLRHGVRSVA